MNHSSCFTLSADSLHLLFAQGWASPPFSETNTKDSGSGMSLAHSIQRHLWFNLEWQRLQYCRCMFQVINMLLHTACCRVRHACRSPHIPSSLLESMWIVHLLISWVQVDVCLCKDWLLSLMTVMCCYCPPTTILWVNWYPGSGS